MESKRLDDLSTEVLQRLYNEKVREKTLRSSVGKSVEDIKMRRYLRGTGEDTEKGETVEETLLRHEEELQHQLRRGRRPLVIQRSSVLKEKPKKRYEGLRGFMENEPDPNRKKTWLDKLLGR